MTTLTVLKLAKRAVSPNPLNLITRSDDDGP